MVILIVVLLIFAFNAGFVAGVAWHVTRVAPQSPRPWRARPVPEDDLTGHTD